MTCPRRESILYPRKKLTNCRYRVNMVLPAAARCTVPIVNDTDPVIRARVLLSQMLSPKMKVSLPLQR